ncbi:MAG: MaoC family dehydratase [Dehalococcoidia bacterium]
MSEVLGVRVGDRAEMTRKVTTADVQMFTDVSGDTNLLHRDKDYAVKTRFGEPIAHGMLSAGYISAVLGTKLAPHACVIYLSQTLRFLKAVKIGDEVRVIAEVKVADEEKRILTLETNCFNQDGEAVVKGEAVVLLDPFEVGA